MYSERDSPSHLASLISFVKMERAILISLDFDMPIAVLHR